MKEILKKMAMTGLAVLLLSVSPLSVMAMPEAVAETIEETDGNTRSTGSLTIELEEISGGSCENVRFVVIRVADLVDGVYVLADAFSGCDVDLNAIETAAALDDAALSLQKACTVDIPKDAMQMITDASGRVELNGLEPGVYLFYVIDRAAYDNIAPCLVSIPMYDDVSDTMMYDVSIYPKHTPDAPKTGDTSKLWLCLVASVVSLIYIIVWIKKISEDVKARDKDE